MPYGSGEAYHRKTSETFFFLFVKFFAKFIHGTENFCNFAVGNHEFILFPNFTSGWYSDIKIQENISDYHFFETSLSRTGVNLQNKNIKICRLLRLKAINV